MVISVRVNICFIGGCGFEKYYVCMYKYWGKVRGFSIEFVIFCEFIIISKRCLLGF